MTLKRIKLHYYLTNQSIIGINMNKVFTDENLEYHVDINLTDIENEDITDSYIKSVFDFSSQYTSMITSNIHTGYLTGVKELILDFDITDIKKYSITTLYTHTIAV